MKLKYFIISLFAALVICGCSQDDEPVTVTPGFVLNEATEVTATSAVITGSIVSQGNVKSRGILYSPSHQVPTLRNGSLRQNVSQQDFSVKLTGLKPNTTYHYCLFAESDYNDVYSEEILTFTTGGN